MRAWQVDGGFGLDKLTRVEQASPPLGPDGVRVAVRAAALNYRDLLMIKGLYDPRLALPLVPLSDGMGEVVEVGSDVTSVAVGDRVAGSFTQGWLDGLFSLAARATTLGGPLMGMLTEERVLPAHGVVPVPEYLSDVEAATLPCAGVTAWNALMVQGRLGPGQTVVLQGTGGVSIYGLQLAKAAGARVVITSSSDDKLARCRDLGADHTINYVETPRWSKVVRSLTDGRGADVILDVGGTETLAESLSAVAFEGTVCLIGVLSGIKASLALTSVFMKQARLAGVFTGSRAMLEALARAMALHQIHPVVDTVVSFDEAPKAFELLEGAGHLGKIVISMA